jgi:ABC-2 type transport system permease protein
MAMRVIDLALKDLSQIVRDWKAAVFLLAMPIAFTLLMGFVFSGAGGAEDARLPVGFLDLDGGDVLSGYLLDLLETSDVIRPVVLEEPSVEEASRQVADADLAAVVIVPTGYSRTLLSATDVTALKPKIVIDENSSAGASALTAVQAAIARLLGSVKAVSISAEALEGRGGVAGAEFRERSLAHAIASWENPPLSVSVNQSGTVVEGEEQAGFEVNNYAHSSAGIMVQFAIAGLMGAAEIIVLERRSGSLRRLLTTPISRTQIIAGHYLAMFVMVLAQLVILVAFGQIVLGVPYLQAPLATSLMVVITALWSASLGLLIGVFAKTDEQVIIYALILMLALAGLGGAWMPLESTSETFQAVGHLTPAAWAIDGFENIVVRGLGLESVLLPAAILLAFAVVLFALATWRFRFE